MKNIEVTQELINRILDVSSGYFRRYGYRKTTVDEIAAALSISKRTLYSVFSSKRDILRETIWNDMVTSLTSFNKNLPPRVKPDYILIALCRYVFLDRVKNGTEGEFRWWYSDEKIVRETFTPLLVRVYADMYAAGKRAGLFRPVDDVFAGHMIVGVMDTALSRFSFTEKPMDMFNDTLKIIADICAYPDRKGFDDRG